MKVDTMPWIDRCVGAPLCALVTPLMRLWHIARARPPRTAPRLLFVELSEIGSTILAEPAMRKARDRLGAELFFVIFRRNVGSLDLVGTISPANIFTIRDTSLFHLAWDSLAFLVWTRRKGIDTVVDLELFSRFTVLLVGLSGGSRRVGFYRFHNEGLYRGEMLTHRVAYNPHIHMAKNFVALVDALLAATPTVPYSKTLIDDKQIEPLVIRPPAGAREAVLARVRQLTGFDPAMQRLVLINPNASELLPHRRWMPDRYGELIRRVIAGHSDVIVLITGAPEEQAEAETLAAACGARCFSFVGKTRSLSCRRSIPMRRRWSATIPGRPISRPRRGYRPLCCSARKRRNSTSRSEPPRQFMRGSPARHASARTITARPRAMATSACVQSASSKSMRRSPIYWRVAVDRIPHS
jgi:ADP-heptose:LPS heptosyltransferase